MTIREAAERLGVSKSTAQRFIAGGLLGYRQVGCRRVITPAQLERFRAEHCVLHDAPRRSPLPSRLQAQQARDFTSRPGSPGSRNQPPLECSACGAEITYADRRSYWRCRKCGYVACPVHAEDLFRLDFCPMCGADLE